MIRAIRPNAMAQDDASLVVGWNVAPNVAYVLRILPGPTSCGVLLYDEDGSTIIATGAALAGTDQPCVLIPQAGQTVGMVDADLGWHLLLTTTGTESQLTIRIGPAVDLPDEIHPVYGDDALALVRATAAIDAAAHYIDDITVTCLLGPGAGLGDVVSVPVDGAAIVGQVESITWTATPDGTSEQAVIRRHVAIAPEDFVEVTPPTVADDTGTATHHVGTSGNVLANDTGTLTVVAVNGMSGNVGVAVDGNNGGSFTISSTGTWTFDPDGDFALLEGTETADTSVTYHASDGTAEAMATLTVTVSHANAAPIAVDDTGETDAATTTSGNVLTNDTDADADALVVSKVAGSAANIGVAVAGSGGGLITVNADGSWTFDPDGDFAALTGEQTATTSVTYHVSDGMAEDEGSLTVTVSATAGDPLWSNVVLCLNAAGVDNSTTIIDETGKTPSIVNGDTKIRTILGYNSIYLDGSGDYMRFAANGADFDFSNGSFCVEAWLYLNTIGGNLFTQRTSTNTYGFMFGFHNNQVEIHLGNGSSWFYSPTNFNLGVGTNTLFHIALIRDGSTIRVARNGTQIHTGTTTGTFKSGEPANVGWDPLNTGIGYYPLSGHIKGFRITKGSPRYIGTSFTPDAAPFLT